MADYSKMSTEALKTIKKAALAALHNPRPASANLTATRERVLNAVCKMLTKRGENDM